MCCPNVVLKHLNFQIRLLYKTDFQNKSTDNKTDMNVVESIKLLFSAYPMYFMPPFKIISDMNLSLVMLSHNMFFSLLNQSQKTRSIFLDQSRFLDFLGKKSPLCQINSTTFDYMVF